MRPKKTPMPRPEFCRSHEWNEIVDYYRELSLWWKTQRKHPLAMKNAESYARIADELQKEVS